MKLYYGYTYEILIPTSDGIKHYYGKKECNSKSGENMIVESYWGSGVIIKDWFLKHTDGVYTSRRCPEEIAKKLGVKRFILNFYKTKKELSIAEKNLIKKHLGKDYCINIAEGGTGGNTGHYVCSEKTKEKRRLSREGRKYWTNGFENKLSFECPGDNWYRGMTLSESEKMRRIESGKVVGKKNNTVKQLENIKKAQLLKRRKVCCVELNMCFNSLKEANDTIFAGKCRNGGIRRSCLNDNYTCGNYHWRYVDEKINDLTD